jgi:raffinose/stachyose/melibiose transport system substrate-binding protein
MPGRLMRGRMLVALALVLVCGLVVGLPSVAAKPKQSVTITGAVSNQNQLAWPYLIANFNRIFPDTKVDMTYAPGGALIQQILTQLQAGTAPDIIGTSAGNGSLIAVWPLAAAGKLVDLSKQPWVKRLYPPLREQMSYNGKVYGMPVAVLPVGAAYNVALFKQLGLSVPKTFAQLISLCGKLRAAGKVPIALALTSPDALSMAFSWAVDRMAQDVYALDPTWSTKRNKKQVTFASSPLWRRAFQSIADLKNAGCFNPAPEGTTLAQAFTMVATGQAAMTVVSGAQIPGIQAINKDIDLKMFPIPADSASKTVAPIVAGPIIVANAATSHRKELSDFFTFMGRPKQQTLFDKLTFGFNPYDAVHGDVPAFMESMAPLLKANRAVNNPYYGWPNPTVLTSALYPGILGLFTGQKSIDKTLADLDYLWDNPTATSAP